MKKTFFLSAILLLLIASCSKTQTNDLTANWIGNYSLTGSNDTVNRVSVAKVNDNTVQMQLQISYNGGTSFNTYTTLSPVTLSTATSGSFIEYGQIAGSPDIFNFVGTTTLNGNDLIVSATYTDTSVHLSIIRYYYFSGSK